MGSSADIMLCFTSSGFMLKDGGSRAGLYTISTTATSPSLQHALGLRVWRAERTCWPCHQGVEDIPQAQLARPCRWDNGTDQRQGRTAGSEHTQVWVGQGGGPAGKDRKGWPPSPGLPRELGTALRGGSDTGTEVSPWTFSCRMGNVLQCLFPRVGDVQPRLILLHPPTSPCHGSAPPPAPRESSASSPAYTISPRVPFPWKHQHFTHLLNPQTMVFTNLTNHGPETQTWAHSSLSQQISSFSNTLFPSWSIPPPPHPSFWPHSKREHRGVRVPDRHQAVLCLGSAMGEELSSVSAPPNFSTKIYQKQIRFSHL